MHTPPHGLPMLIVGAGHVGGRAAQALREAGWDGPITLVGDEPHRPYERPPLSKDLLAGMRDAASCALRPDDAWAADCIDQVAGRVEALHPADRAVVLADGRTLRYQALLLATGGTVRRLAIPGADGPRVHVLRTLDDAAALAPALQPGARVVVVGGGFIGLEVAATARSRGVGVTVVEGAPRLLGRAVPAPIAARVQALHQARGVRLRLGVLPTAIDTAADGSLVVTLADGTALPADRVVVGIGIEPATALARAAGLQVERGIRVDAQLRTSAPGVYAAGDAVEFPSRLSGRPIRQETWHNAETQARTAARNMLGAGEAYDAWPWFWSDQHDHQLQVAGEPALGTAEAVRPLGDDGVIHFHLDDGGRLVGMSGFGPVSAVAKELKLARLLLERGVRADPARLADPAVKLKALL